MIENTEISRSWGLLNKLYLSVLCVSVISYVCCMDDELNIPESRSLSHKANESLISEETQCSIVQTSNNGSTTSSLEPAHTIEEQELFRKLKESGLYYNMESVMKDVNHNKFLPGIIDLISVHNRSEWISKTREYYQARDRIQKKKRMVFINIETIYSSKREIIAKEVAKRLFGKKMTSPPKFMADIRVIVGPGLARKLYYSLTKYSTAYHIQMIINTHPVVLERYWFHHAAFIISQVSNKTELPPRGHPVYKWPKDLLAPDLLFFVNASKDSTSGFQQVYSPLTERIIQVFRRVEGVKVVEMSPSQNYLTIVRYIVSYVRENFKDHPSIVVPSRHAARDTWQKRRRHIHNR